MFRLRPAHATDLAALLELASYLDSPNLPADEAFLAARLWRSSRAFALGGAPSRAAEYQFALEDEAGRMIGTSAVLSKHGTPDMPHTFLQVAREERYSPGPDVRAEHVTLRFGVCTDGPSELGSLILHPDARGAPDKPGQLLSWGRFAFVALHRECFCETLLAEMRAALDPQGRSAFWEAFGQRFTGMSYDEADKRSAVDKDFIVDLFPDTTFYATLFDPDVVAELGKVHEEARPAVRLLEQAGLRWNGHIDPFDAGPFYAAASDDVVPIQQTRLCSVARDDPKTPAEAVAYIASAGRGAEFRAVACATRLDPPDTPDTLARLELAGEAVIPTEARARLGVEPGDPVAITPLPRSTNRGGAHG